MLRQAIAITGISIRSIPERWAPSLVIIVGLAGVVAVFTALLAMAAGFESTLKATGRTDAALVLRGGSDAELNSAYDRASTDLIKEEPGIATGADGKPLASAELMVIAELVRKDDISHGANITLRGVEPAAFALRPQLKIVAGRNFTPGLRELIVGRGVLQQFQGAALGDTVRMRGSEWKVVGIFASGDAHDSEMWADINVARSTFGRQGSSSVLVALDGPAVFAALNSMYAAVAARGKEIATLRALGFGGLPVVTSVMTEALLLALAGGVLGAVIAYTLFNNLSVSTLGQNFTQVVFDFKVTPQLVARGLIIALIIGMIGGFMPALRAARLPVTASLREQ